MYQPIAENQVNGTPSDNDVVSPDATTEEKEQLHPHYNPLLFCDGGLYLDPDIIGEMIR